MGTAGEPRQQVLRPVGEACTAQNHGSPGLSNARMRCSPEFIRHDAQLGRGNPNPVGFLPRLVLSLAPLVTFLRAVVDNFTAVPRAKKRLVHGGLHPRPRTPAL